MGDAAKAVLGGNFLALNSYTRRKEWFKFKDVKKKKQIKPKVSWNKETRKIAEIKELENKETIEKINKAKFGS